MSVWSPRQAGHGDRGPSLRHTYECLRNLLNRNTILLEQMSEIEADLRFSPVHHPLVYARIRRMTEDALLLAEDLNVLTRGRFESLYSAHARMCSELRAVLQNASAGRRTLPLSVSLDESAGAGKDLVGGKAYHLGIARGVIPGLVPQGFVVTTEAYWQFLDTGGLFSLLMPTLRELEVIHDKGLLRHRLGRIKDTVRGARLPASIEDEIQRHSSLCRAPCGWAVRSSAVGEDDRSSFAGQFESVLNVPEEELCLAYREVVASRYEERAVAYRRSLGIREIDTPMAVLFLAMVEASSAGVLYTRDPGSPGKECMLVNAVWGSARDLVRGHMEADRFSLSRSHPGEVVEKVVVPKPHALVRGPSRRLERIEVPPDRSVQASLDPGQLRQLWETGHVLEEAFDGPVDIEWVIDPSGRLWVVQVRPLALRHEGVEIGRRHCADETPLLEGGCSVQPGRAVGEILKVEGEPFPKDAPPGSILVVPVATPDIAVLLPYLAGCIAEAGNPAGHAATLLREWRIPSVFGVRHAVNVLRHGETVGLDATNRRLYRGNPWPEIAKAAGEKRAPPDRALPGGQALSDRLFLLTLCDPSSPRFRPEGIRSLHDLIRFVHEKAVEASFALGDAQKGQRHSRVVRLDSEIPLNVLVLDLGGGTKTTRSHSDRIDPEEITSVPFQALWSGVIDPRVRWTGRRQVSLRGFSSVLVSSFAGSEASGRKLGEPNYLLVAADYINMNLRLAYHYAMIDAFVGDCEENNFVNFRFRGGGARAERRELRARFLAETLRRLNFSVDRRSDLVTAWYRRYPRSKSEHALRLLGRLMGCSRQLDMLLSDEQSAHQYADRFIAEDYEAFA